ncbi:dihydrofolate reductase [Aerococcus agrisoli]|uniref:Dihydrofolate reductase n=1 Tax=Aerococcus agrisoli TaxID=2487350 RepID=A0A3N4GP87_9LACT|nr:dihydrofolate reductase [Aerococcus agrisoli]RPA62466.1 dihydrofolate reductase [Aerococcus agrisoli]
MLIAIWAQDLNHLIGKEGVLPWHLPNDLKFFKEQTLGKTVVMGRKTYAGLNYKPLPNRRNIVITRQTHPFQSEFDQINVELTDNIEEIVRLGETEDVIIMGGYSIYRLFWPFIQELRVTTIYNEFEGDVHFNPDLSDFEAYEVIEGEVDDKNIYPHKFVFYRRNDEV